MPLDAALIAAICDAERTRELFAGRYRLVEGIGAGDFAFTYKATDEVTGETVVVRVAKRSRASLPGVLETFVKAARGADGVEHPDLPRVLADGVTEDGCPFVVRTFFAGVPTMTLRQRGELHGREIVEVLAALAEPLAAMHAKGQVHGALEGRRAIVAAGDGKRRVALLGVGRLALEEATGSGPVGRSCLAPEVKAGAKPTALSDVYGFCAMCAELAMGHAFTGGWRKAVDGVGVEGLQQTIERGLNVDPAARWQSVEGFAAALRFLLLDSLARSQPTSVHDVETMSRAPAVSPKASTGETPNPVAYSVATMASPKLEGVAPIAREEIRHDPQNATLVSPIRTAEALQAPKPANLTAVEGHTGSPRPGDLFGRYRIEELLGRGGMGEVYRAHDTRLKRDIAIKVLRTDGEWPSDGVEKVFREAQAAAALHHSGIVAVHDVDTFHSIPYITMELLRGKSLRAYIGDSTVDETTKARWLIGILDALGAAHTKGIVHRDLKPENVMVLEDGSVKVLDFGIARLQASEDTTTSRNTVAGTPLYMAPEQFVPGPIDGRADQYSLGIMAYELLSGARIPYPKVSHRDAIYSSPAIPEVLKPVLLRMLMRHPADRFESTTDIRWAFRLLAPSRNSLSVTRQSPNSPSIASLLARQRRPRRAWHAALLALTLGGIAVSSVANTTRRPETSLQRSSSAAVTILDDLPSRVQGEAASNYKSALALLRDASSTDAVEHARDALKADTGMAQAALAALITSSVVSTSARMWFRKAVDNRDRLTPDQARLLTALEPDFMSPPDALEMLRRLRDLQALHPGDDLLRGTLAHRLVREGMLDEAKALLQNTTATSQPRQLFTLGILALSDGDVDQAEMHLKKCIEASPSGTDCLNLHAFILARLGKCDEMREVATKMIAVAPTSPRGHDLLAEALAGQDAPTRTVEAALEQKWTRVPTVEREVTTTLDRAELAIRDGRFDDAQSLLKTSTPNQPSHADSSEHSVYYTMRVRLNLELSNTETAQSIAKELRDVAPTWTRTSYSDPDADVLWALYFSGSISRDEMTQRRATLLASHPPEFYDTIRRWQNYYLLQTKTESDAHEALHLFQEEVHSVPLKRTSSTTDFAWGEVCRMAGAEEDALRAYHRSAHACTRHDYLTRAAAQLHVAELTREPAEKCEEVARAISLTRAFPSVSVTAKAAKRLLELSCSHARFEHH